MAESMAVPQSHRLLLVEVWGVEPQSDDAAACGVVVVECLSPPGEAGLLPAPLLG